MIGEASNHDTYGGDMASYRGTPVRVVLEAPSVMYHNLSVTRAFPDQKMVARFGVNNVMGKKPPRLTTLNLGQVNTEGNSAFYSQYNWVGRAFFLNVSKDF